MSSFTSFLKNLIPDFYKTWDFKSDSNRQPQDLQQSSLDSSPDAVVVIDREGKIKAANKRAAKLYGFTDPFDMVGKSKTVLVNAQELEKIKKQFAESKSFMAAIAEPAEDPISGKDLNGRITSWNKGAEKLYGYKKEEALGQSVSIVYPPELKDELQKILAKLKRGELIQHIETVRINRDGRRIPVSMTISPVLDEKGNVRGVSSIGRDISREKELDRLKDEFISLTSHALRTPLSAIKGLISMIYEGDYGPMNKNLEKPLANISSSTERLIKLVNNLLKISRAKTGKLEYKLADFSLADLMAEILKELGPMARENKIEVNFIRSEIPQVQSDEAKTRDILTNLLSNAFKFTNKGSIEISFKQEQDTVTVFVKDTGIGISDKDKAKLFQRFQQIANVTSKQITGTGLGLYLSKMMAQRLGGDIWLAESELKKGSTFGFSLPKAGSVKAKEVAEALSKNHSKQLV